MINEENMEKLYEVSEGNPGFITAFMSMLPLYTVMLSMPHQQDQYIAAFISYLKEKELTGPNLWVLFKDEHSQSAEDTLLVLMQDGLTGYVAKAEEGFS